MHVAWKGRFQPDPARPPITLARVRAQVASRLATRPALPHAAGVPAGGLRAPVWVDAEGFDLRRHVRRAGLRRRGAGDRRASTRSADAALSRPLDRCTRCGRSTSRRGSRTAASGLLMKIHHAMVDGKSALAVALLLLDLDPDAPEPAPPAEAWAGDRAPGAARLAVEALVDSGTEPLRALGRAARAAGSPAAARRDAAAGGDGGRRGRRALGAVVVPQRPRSARGARSSATRCRSTGCSTVKRRAASRSTTSRSRWWPARCASSRCCGASRPRRSR